MRDRSGSQSFKIIAHRGVTARAPGNTLAAFREALELGVDGVELDVRLSRDHVPVVHHDWYLDEEPAKPVPIHTLSAAQLRGEMVRDRRAELSQRHPVPSLEDVLQEFAGTLALEIELKSPEPELARAVVSVLESFRAAWPTIELTSSSTSLLAAVCEISADLRTAFLFGETAPYMHLDVVAYLALQSARLARATVVHLAPDQLSEEVMTTLSDAGVGVHVYLGNHVQALELIERYRLSEVITDDPAGLLGLVKAQRREAEASSDTGEESL